MVADSKSSNPYVGPRAFKRDESLYGRSREVADLLDLLVAERIVLMYSPSGAGKSSLINAALISKLLNAQFEVLPVIRVGKEFSSTVAVPNRYVLSALLSLEQGRSPEHQIPLERLASMTLSDYLEHKPVQGDVRGSVVFIIDQFEEILNRDPTDQVAKQEFFVQMGTVLRNPDRWALFSMREEYLAGLEPYLHLVPRAMSARYRLELLGEKAARIAIEKPARVAGVEFSDLAAKALVDDLRTVNIRTSDGAISQRMGPYVEPLQLQVVCESLWEALPRDIEVITPDDLREFGDVNEALHQYYENALQATTEKTGIKEDDLRRWFNEYLITPSGTRGMAYRDKEHTGRGGAGIPNAAVDELERRYVIRAEIRSGGELWYELTHDRFINPIQEANEGWKARMRGEAWRRKILLKGGVVVAIMATITVLVVGLAFRERLEYRRTEGQLDELLKLYETNPETAQYTGPTVLDNVAGYLWQKETTVLDKIAGYLGLRETVENLQKLSNLLKRGEKFITEDYGVDPWVAIAMPTTAEDEPWPITVKFHPRRNLNLGKVQFQWRKMAVTTALQWGVPAPMSLKLQPDEKLPIDKIMITAESDPDAYSDMDPIIDHIDIPALPGFMLVTENQFPERLVPWFSRHNRGWTKVASLTYGGDWWLVPKWTAPLFKAAGHSASPREAAIAVAVANQILHSPELVLNRRNVSYMLNQIRASGFSSTVDEAVAARGGLEGLVRDLQEIVRLRYPLSHLGYLLDALATYPRKDYSSVEVAHLVFDAHSYVTAPAHYALIGRRETEEREKLKYELTREEQLPYRGSVELLVSEPPVRVYLGDQVIKEFVGAGRQLHRKRP